MNKINNSDKLKEFDKYTNMIKKFIDNNMHQLFSKINFSFIKNNHKINDLNNHIISSFNKVKSRNYNQTILKKIHNNNEYPLNYIFYCNLYKEKLININNICDFNKFLNWYRLKQKDIDIRKIKEKVNIFLKKNNNSNLNNIYELMYYPIESRTDLHNLLYENNFIYLDVQQHAETSDLIKLDIIEKDNYNVVLFIPEGDKIYSNKDNIIFKICHILQFFKILKKELTIPKVIIFAGKQRKIFNKSDKILCSDNVNSGATSKSINKIMIWRYEEIYKVLIHELVHYYSLDISDHFITNKYDNLTEYIIKKYNIKYFDIPNEAITEIKTLLINSLFVSYYTNYNISEILKYEMLFTLLQVSKILLYFSINKTCEIGLENKKINQLTAAFSYFYIKGSLIFYLDKIIENTDNYYEIIMESLNNKIYLNLIDETIDIIKDKYNLDENNDIMSTLRMTMFSL